MTDIENFLKLGYHDYNIYNYKWERGEYTSKTFSTFYEYIIDAMYHRITPPSEKISFYDEEQVDDDMQFFFMFFKNEYGRRTIDKKSDYNNEGTFTWFEASPNIYRDEYFLYTNSPKTNNIFKAYMSIKTRKYVETLIKLQYFFEEFYNNHLGEKIGQWKFRKLPSNDAISIRFTNEEHYHEFLQFLDKHPEIQKDYDTPNIFIPRDEYGLSLIIDDGNSYNEFITLNILNYFSHCKENNLEVSSNSFAIYIKNYDFKNDNNFKNYSDNILTNYIEILTGKILGIPDNELIQLIFKKATTMLRK